MTTPRRPGSSAVAWATSRSSQPGSKAMWESTCRNQSSPSYSAMASARAQHGPRAYTGSMRW
jgi:hypothetical protein